MLNLELQYSFDGIDLQNVVVATYFMEIDRGDDIVFRARKVASLIYPGAWTDTAGYDLEASKKHAARILGIYETPPYEIELPADSSRRRFIVQLAIPLIDIEWSVASLLTSVAGEILAYSNLKLLDLYLPRSFVEHFKGPKFGVEGLRKLLGVYGRPLLLAIIKPSQGYSPAEGAASFFDAASGGVDIVKDEELLSDPSYCKRVKRVELYRQAEKRAFEETGEHTLYAVNITDRVDRLLPNALEALEAGANALMVNYMAIGLEATQMLCEDSRVTVPILGHNSGVTSIHASTHTGMSSLLINGKLPRLCGVDLGIALSGLGSFPVLPERLLLLVRDMLSPFHNIPPTLPIIANGVTPGRVAGLLRTYGNDIALGAGSAIFGHPQGASAGGRAFRQAITCCLEGRDLDSTLGEYQELSAAVKLWGNS